MTTNTLFRPKNEHQSLKPCPFCGADAAVYETYPHVSGEWRWRILCGFSPCGAILDPGYATDSFTVQRLWNRRAEGGDAHG